MSDTTNVRPGLAALVGNAIAGLTVQPAPDVQLARQIRRLMRRNPDDVNVVLTEGAAQRLNIPRSVQVVEIKTTANGTQFGLYAGLDQPPVYVAAHEVADYGTDDKLVAA